MGVTNPQRHEVTRIRRETRRREVTVISTSMLAPRMKRIVFASDDLRDFDSAAPDDHVKLFIPDVPHEDGKQVMRDYTPRAFDTAQGTLTIDFALHEAGPATAWAINAKTGDAITIGGPRGSNIVPDDFDWYLLVGDETALPTIARRLEELRRDAGITCILIVDHNDGIIELAGNPNTAIHWLKRSTQKLSDDRLVTDLLKQWQAPEGEGYVFIAAEASVSHRLKNYMLTIYPNPQWIKASGYWVSKGPASADSP